MATVSTTPAAAIVVVADVGEPGKRGEKGEPGAPGVSGGHYVHTQNNPSHVWTVIHNLGYRPGGFAVTDADGNDHEPVVRNMTDNVSMLLFVDPISGVAEIS